MVIGIVNPNSPLVWDGLMVETLVACAEFGQPVAITPFLLAGASAPVTLAAGLSLLIAETLAGVAMAQLVRPGTPCILGCFFNGVDMRSGGPSLGLPESVLTTLAGAQIARRYGLPLRGGGGLCSGIALDAQAATESAMSLWATYLAGCDLVVHSAGWLEGGLVASYEKFAIDLEVIRMFERLREGLAVDDESLAFDTVAEVGPGGLFLAHDHTLARFRTDVFMSPLFRSQAYPTWVKLGSPAADEVATGEWRKLLDSYVDPGISDDLDAELRAYVDRRTAEIDAA
jgi:trimethylamine--corrinoid protein Co-methyltransferase